MAEIHFPYYELMWKIDPQVTKQYIEAFWSAHILNWSNLDMNRYANHGNIKEPLGKVWKHEYKGGPVFSQGSGSFSVTGADLYFAGAMLSELSAEKEPLIWSKRLAQRYVETRFPEIGIRADMYTQLHKGFFVASNKHIYTKFDTLDSVLNR
jgi:pectate lyase